MPRIPEIQPLKTVNSSQNIDERHILTADHHNCLDESAGEHASMTGYEEVINVDGTDGRNWQRK